jgi:hypothetical protein
MIPDEMKSKPVLRKLAERDAEEFKLIEKL